MASTLTRVESWTLLGLTAACLGIIAKTFHGDGEPLIASLAFSGIAFAFTFSLIRWLGETFMKANLKGRDMSKLKKVEMCVCVNIFTTARCYIDTKKTDPKPWAQSVLLYTFSQ